MIKTRAAVLREMERPRPYAGSRPLTLEEIELDPPGTGEVLVELAAAGLCHSDLSVINGSRPRPLPMVMGHEACGVVREVGRDVSTLKTGDHVVFSFVATCGHCLPCLSGRAPLCEPAARANTSGTLLNGSRHFTDANGDRLHHHQAVSGYSELTVTTPESLVRIDPDIPLDVAVLFGCAVMTGFGAVVNTARVAPGTSVAVFGLGGVGLSTIMGAAAAGAWPIIAVDPIAAKLDLARRAGASHTVDASKDSAVEAVRTLTDGGAETVFEAVGSAKVLGDAFAATRRGGRTVTVGLPNPAHQLSIPAVTVTAEERVLMGSYMGSCVPARDIPRFLNLYRAGRLPAELLTSRKIKPEQLNEGFDALDRGEVARQIVEFR